MDRVIWHLARAGDWQEMVGCVVVAMDEDSARKWAASECGDEGTGPWFDPATPCVRLGMADDHTEFGMICRDYLEV